MSEKKDEQFSVEVEKRLQNLFNEDISEQPGDFKEKEDKVTFTSDDDEAEDLSETDLIEEDSLGEILPNDLLEDVSDDDLEDTVLNDDLEENVLADDFNENVLDDDFNETEEQTDFGDDKLLFPDEEEACKEATCIKESGEFQFYPFRLLKSIILSIDWEITDDVMERFVAQVTGLMETYKDDRFVLIFLHLLWELGKYIKKYRGQSHPNSIKTLISVYNALEKIVSQKDLDDAAKKKILSSEMLKFKSLKDQISVLQGGTIEREAVVSSKITPEVTELPIESPAEPILEKVGMTGEISDEMINMVKTLVRSEMQAFLSHFLKTFEDWASKR